MNSDPTDLTEAWYSHAAAVEQKLGTMAEMFSQMVSSLNAQIDTDRDIRTHAAAIAGRVFAASVGKANGGMTVPDYLDLAEKIEDYIHG